MAWESYQRERLALEWTYLRQHSPNFGFYEPTGNTYVAGWWTSNNDRLYQLRISVPPGYPDECPSTYITHPSPLMAWRHSATIESYGTSHEMHVWQTDRPGWVRICTYRPEQWSAAHSMLKIIRKALLWIVAYECHLEDGQPLKNFLMDA
jgi:ubiquitin-protein ligase